MTYLPDPPDRPPLHEYEFECLMECTVTVKVIGSIGPDEAEALMRDMKGATERTRPGVVTFTVDAGYQCEAEIIDVDVSDGPTLIESF